jgi:hypothetical protein
LRQLTELRTAQSNQRRLVTDPTVRGSTATRCGKSSTSPSAPSRASPIEPFARLIAELPEIGTLSIDALLKLIAGQIGEPADHIVELIATLRQAASNSSGRCVRSPRSRSIRSATRQTPAASNVCRTNRIAIQETYLNRQPWTRSEALLSCRDRF